MFGAINISQGLMHINFNKITNIFLRVFPLILLSKAVL